jgi:hypothetical protein
MLYRRDIAAWDEATSPSGFGLSPLFMSFLIDLQS